MESSLALDCRWLHVWNKVMCEVTIVWNVELLILVDIPVILEELIALICGVISFNFRVKRACLFEMLILKYLLHCITFQDIMDYRRCHKKIRFCR